MRASHVVVCVCLAATVVTAGGNSEAAAVMVREITLADVNRNVDRMIIMLEQITRQMQEMVDGGLKDSGDPDAPPGSRAEVSAERNQPEGTRVQRQNIDKLPVKGGGRPAEEHSVRDTGDEKGRGDAEGGGDKDEEGDGDDRGRGQDFLVVAIFIHEVWLLLQHANILLNPLCQRLDRNYGVALLKRRLYWVIAGVLSAYWAREMLSMLAASPFASPLTRKMVAMSSVYHLAKILLISLDARRQWSPTLGIMRLLMDHWHMSSVRDALLCVKRVALQVFDTATHALIVRDMVLWDEDTAERKLWLSRKLMIVSLVWAMHAIANLVTKISTATLVVELAKSVVESREARGRKYSRSASMAPCEGMKRGGGVYGALDGGSAEYACTTSCSHGHKRCEVCHLLTRDKPTAAAPLAQRKRVD